MRPFLMRMDMVDSRGLRSGSIAGGGLRLLRRGEEEVVQRDLELLERRDAHLVAAGVRPVERPGGACVLVDLEDRGLRVSDPVPGDLALPVDPALELQVVALVAGR